ncbi:DsbA family protein [Patescibacteria group bacterium]|nr:DsbA family protein [Patescibacteria group bacterium]
MTDRPSIFNGVSPKLSFIMGLVVGVAAISLIGFIVAVAFSFSGGSFSKKTATSNPSANLPVDNNPSQQPSLGPVDIAVKDSDYLRGSKDAPIVMIEYSDLECPFCQKFHDSMKKIMADYPGQIAWIYRHFPLSFHANAQKEAEGAECVGKLGGADKYWQFIDKIFERTTATGTGFALDKLPALAKEVGVNEAKFKTCLDSGEMAQKVQTDLQEGSAYGVGGTPTTFVNGQPLEGALPYEQVKSVVDQILNK